MKTEVRILNCIPLIIALILSSGGQMSGQKKANISFGIGFPELINVGIKYQVSDQTKIGFSIGYWPPSKPDWLGYNNLISLSGDFYYHFGGSSDFPGMRPWYGRIGLNIIFDLPSDYHILSEDIFLRTGRDIYFDENNGISLDGGFGVNFYDYTNLFPAFGICYFHRF